MKPARRSLRRPTYQPLWSLFVSGKDAQPRWGSWASSSLCNWYVLFSNLVLRLASLIASCGVSRSRHWNRSARKDAPAHLVARIAECVPIKPFQKHSVDNSDPINTRSGCLDTKIAFSRSILWLLLLLLRAHAIWH